MEKTKRKGANSTYFGDIVESIKTLSKGLGLTFRHILQATKRRNAAYISDKDYFKDHTGLVTLSYPYESLPVPDNGRYRLHNEIDDCIVCDKCAKVCPVDCITIESIKATEEIGKTSDGTSKRLYAPIFDIDLAKCCYCGLCTTVCPTECLTMTKAYDFSEVDVDNFVYKFADMLPQEADQKRKELEIANAEKEAAKAAKLAQAAPKVEARAEAPNQVNLQESTQTEAKPAARPAFRPKVKPATSSETEQPDSQKAPEIKAEIQGEFPSEAIIEPKPAPSKPVFRPKIRATPSEATPKPVEEATQNQSASDLNTLNTQVETKPEEQGETKPAARPVFRPKVRPVIPQEKKEDELQQHTTLVNPEAKQPEATETKSEANTTVPDQAEAKPAVRPVFKPKVRPVIQPLKKEEADSSLETTATQPATPPEEPLTTKAQDATPPTEEAKPAPSRPIFRPKIRAPKPPEDPNKTI